MYNCIKFFKKIFIKLKNTMVNFEFKKFLKYVPKKIIINYIKNLYFSKKKENIRDLRIKNNFLKMKMKLLFPKIFN